MRTMRPTRRDCLRWIGGACTAGIAGVPSTSSATPLTRVLERGVLKVGLYHDMPPFHVDGKGIDVDLAQALAESLGVRPALLPFHADDSICLLYTSPSPRDGLLSRMPSSA